MTSSRIKRLTVASVIASVSAGVSAQAIDEVVVTAAPIRDSAQASIEAKRNADNYVDIVSADTIGQFPDQNLADSLGRLPGLAIERDQGQARYINLRGAPFRYTSIAFDGIDVPGAENGRIPRFDSFPSVITGRIEANKAVLPSMPGESVAGFINIHTFSPFSQEGLSIATDVGTGQQELGDGDIEKYGLRASWSNDNFGVMLFGSHNEREQITDNREFELERNAGGELAVGALDFRSYKVTREDSAHGARFDYRSNGGLVDRVFFSTLYSEFLDYEERNAFLFEPTTASVGTTADAVPMVVSRSLEYGLYENSTDTNTLGIDMNLGAWLLEARANYTETEFGMYLPILQSAGGLVMGNYDLHDLEDPELYLDRDLRDLSYAGGYALQYAQRLDIEATKLKVDASREFEWFGQQSTLAAGLQWDSREADGFVATPVVGALPSTVNIDDFNTGKRWHSNTSNTIGGTYYNNKDLRRAWERSGATFNDDSIGPENRIALEEEILAAYAMTTTNFSWGNLVAGFRVEKTDYSSEGTMQDGAIKVSESFTKVLPSVHLNVDLADDVRWRVSATTGLNRPTYNEWRAAATVDVEDAIVRGGNPTLEAEEAIGLDTSLEWYFAPASILSVGAFYRQIDNVIYTDVSTIDGGLYLPAAAGQAWEFHGAVNGKDGRMQGVELTATVHADAYLPEIFNGFGITANATIMDSEFKALDGRTLDLPGTSDLVYNASLFYENHDLSLRLNYQYRDEWISPIEDPSEYWGKQKRVDFSAIYTLPAELNGMALSLYTNLNNLTNETDVRYAGNDTINQVESYGRQYLVGLRLNF